MLTDDAQACRTEPTRARAWDKVSPTPSHDAGFVVTRDPTESSGPPLNEGGTPRTIPVEVVERLANARLARQQHPGDLRRAHQRVRSKQDQRPLPRRRDLRLFD